MSPSRSRNAEGPTEARQTQPALSNCWVWSSARPGGEGVDECLFSEFGAHPRSSTSLNPVLFCQYVCLPMFTALLSVTNDKSWFVSGTYEDFDEHRSTCNINGFLQ